MDKLNAINAIIEEAMKEKKRYDSTNGKIDGPQTFGYHAATVIDAATGMEWEVDLMKPIQDCATLAETRDFLKDNLARR